MHSYAQNGGGTEIPQQVFPIYAARASAVIDRATFGRIRAMDPPPEGAEDACLAIAAVLYRETTSAGGGTITAEHAGDLSVTYADGELLRKNTRAEIREILSLYLSDYLYRGI